MSQQNAKFDTEVIHAAYNPDDHNRALMPPLYQNSMFAMHEINEQVAFKYSRLSNPTRKTLEDTIAALEHGTHGFAFASGIAGIDCIFRAFLRPNDTIVAVSDIYGGCHDLLRDVYAPWGVNVIFADLTQPENLDKILAEHKVKMVWLETPSNPLLRLVDIELLAKKAKAHGAIVGIDNTFATPYLQNPLDMGCDIVFHSATKYLCGHSDVLLGVATVKGEEFAKPLNAILPTTGAIAGPMDCWLVLRGIKTLSVRMRQHLQNAQIIAERLEKHPAVAKVYYPGLPSHEHHELAKKQMRGFGGVVTIVLKNDSMEGAQKFVRSLKMFRLASSLGGVESLVNHCYSQSHSGMPHDLKMGLGIKEGLLRLSVGIEDIEDIYADLDNALKASV
ncbi:PLP-dependent aspartate aminotransferase family protein [Kingella negevensis]|uniref:trans-sulfuration enzyme family protein n=1 Tax=Kingella negevensis TaxID=1522312 RepID=UPI002542AFC9|nr:PLP-dependent aspartate aminotransferase family protein [Kingella negevensis]MDK4681312.1 PLP-dependent aspartate aminotransferase family protein [Kingella negevensis]MDK4683509.1 PLP-dependent aspartate aminotransferase family protein [Kingella negevensis]MDK4691356.1 PLP-dependent aspartate aminotransferase family protein [Kingella negevensis]MDK4693495.1 PLP-dependent aspartate aminotransferase family protein [Kingella negevensis]MDK4700108.1 PLP-dependent aspartate aminotransferase fami